MPVTWNAVYLGKFAVMDTSGGDQDVESPGVFANRTYGSKDDPLFKKFVTITPNTSSTTYSQGDTSNAYDNSSDGQVVNGTAIVEYFYSYEGKTNAGEVPAGAARENHAYDSEIVYNATITYTDGTTANTTAVVFQDWNGETFWAPEAVSNSDQVAMDAKPIASLTLGGTASTAGTGIFANRDVWDYAVCFTPGTMIETGDGAKPVERLKSGDLVVTADRGLQPIRWIGSRKLMPKDLEATPNLYPIRIKAGALGENSPTNDLTVSPQHRVLVRSKIAQRMFGSDEVLVAAKQLLEADRVEVAHDVKEIEYIHFIFDQHEVVTANGALTESMFTGPEALKAVSDEARDEILSIFPELQNMPPARVLVNGRRGRQLASRHVRNEVALVS